MPFGLFTCHPRTLLSLDVAIANVEGILVTEVGEHLIDPLLCLGQKVYSPYTMYLTKECS